MAKYQLTTIFLANCQLTTNPISTLSIGDTLSNSLQRLQNSAARIVTGAAYSTPSGEVFEELGWS